MTTQGAIFEYGLRVATLDDPTLRVERVDGEEALSTVGRVVVTALAAPALRPAGLVGQPATLEVRREGEAVRWFHGVVWRARVSHPLRDVARLTLEIRPRLARLTLGRESRWFQHQGVQQIATTLLQGAGLAADDCHWRLHDAHAALDAAAQRQESDWAFLARLLADHGIALAVESDADADRVVLFDSARGPRRIEGEATLHDRHASLRAGDTVTEVREDLAACIDAVTLHDDDPAQPRTTLRASAQDAGAGREYYAHPGGFTSAGAGRRRAERTLEHLRRDARQITGRSDCPRLQPGRTFQLAGHPRQSLNGEWLVVAVTHRGHGLDEAGEVGNDYENTFVAIPAATVFRPDHLAHDTQVPASPPSAPGAQVAFVTAPQGEEIHTDSLGRTRLRFAWDRAGVRDHRSSPSARVGQAFTGGSMIHPREGFEVLVEAEHRDAARPLVVGHMYNGRARAPYGLPGGSTRGALQSGTTAGGGGANELRFEDAAGGEEVFLNASRDLTTTAEQDGSWTVTQHQTHEIGAEHTVRVAFNHQAEVGAARQLTVNGDLSLDVGGSVSQVVGGNATTRVGSRRMQVGGDLTETLDGGLRRSVTGTQSVLGVVDVTRTVAGDATTRVTLATTQLTAGAAASTVEGARRETIGALKMQRAQSLAVTTGTTYHLLAAGEALQCRGSRTDSATGALAVSSPVGYSVQARTVTFEARAQLVAVLGGVMIRLSPLGTVSIRALRVDLRGVKALSGLIHRGG